MEYEIFSRGAGVLAINSGLQTVAGTVNGPWIDTLNGPGSTGVSFDAFIANILVSGTAGQITAVGANISELASHSDSVADTGAQVLIYPLALPFLPAASPGAILRVGLVTKPRYFQLTFTIANTASGLSLTILGTGELNNAKTAPAALASSTMQASQISDPGNIVSGSNTYIGNPPLRTGGQ